jgi:hypothetical protein
MSKWSRSAILIAASFLGIEAFAQQTRNAPGRVDLAITYNAAYAGLVQGNRPFWLSDGGGAELSADAFHGLGVSMHIMGLHTSNTGTGVPLNLVTTTFGPRYTWHAHRVAEHGVSIFAEGLIGETHGFGSVFPGLAGPSTNSLSFASEAGGGVDVEISRHFSVRLVEASWLRSQLPNSSLNVQNDLTLGAGFVIHSGSSGR